MSKKDKKSKEVVLKESTEVGQALNAEMFAGMGLGAGDEIDFMDIKIPKILLTQAQSKVVQKGKAPIGKYINSITNDDFGKEMKVIVLSSYKTWQVFKKIEGKRDEYLETIPYYTNDKLPYNETLQDGTNISRTQVLGFYVVRIEDIQEDSPMPYVLDFKKGSKSAGRDLSTYCDHLRKGLIIKGQRLPSFAKVFTLGVELVENENTYFIKTISMGRNITGREYSTIIELALELKDNKEKYSDVDDSDLKDHVVDIIHKEIETTSKVKF